MVECYDRCYPLAPSLPEANLRLCNISSASILNFTDSLIFWQKMAECQTAWIRMRRRVTRRLIQIQAVCICHYGSGTGSERG